MSYLVRLLISIICLVATLVFAKVINIDSVKLLAFVAFIKVVMLDLEK